MGPNLIFNMYNFLIDFFSSIQFPEEWRDPWLSKYPFRRFGRYFSPSERLLQFYIMYIF